MTRLKKLINKSSGKACFLLLSNMVSTFGSYPKDSGNNRNTLNCNLVDPNTLLGGTNSQLSHPNMLFMGLVLHKILLCVVPSHVILNVEDGVNRRRNMVQRYSS